MKSILDPAFTYTPAHKTDVRATFARIRAEQAAQQQRAGTEPPPEVVNVSTLRPRQTPKGAA